MMTGDADRIFVDTNILVYATVVSAPEHALANDALQRARSSSALIISPQILREYISVVTRLRSSGSGLEPVTMLENVALFRAECTVVDDTSTMLDRLIDLVRNFPGADRRIYDTNIVATMLTYGIHRLLTHNTSDFERYARLITIEPLEPPPPDASA